eukprot:4945988-Prymnesium_polylepis.1
MDEYKYGLRYRMYRSGLFKLKPVLDELKKWSFRRPSSIRRLGSDYFDEHPADYIEWFRSKHLSDWVF